MAFAGTQIHQTQGQAPVKEGASQVAITLTAANNGSCLLDYTTAKAGPVTFTITNKTATSISEVELQSNHRILGERENLAPGLPPASFTVTLGGGTYNIYCPGAHRELQSFTVTGQAIKAKGDVVDLLNDGAKGYAHYVEGMVDAMVTAVTQLKTDIDAGDLAKAKAQYPRSRIFYERIESDVEGFILPGYAVTDSAGSLDYLIDMRESSLDPKVGWHGFHAIERDLFKFNRIDKNTKAQAAELLENIKRLRKVAQSLDFKPEDLANGAAGLLEEVLSSKISGEEESFSHYDLVDFAGNVEGAQQAFAFLKPGLMKIDPTLTQQVSDRFDMVEKMLDQYRDPKMPGGFVLYTAELKKKDAAKLSRAIQTLQEPLARIAAKVATAGVQQ
jgi:iron uptake system component EfeO